MNYENNQFALTLVDKQGSTVNHSSEALLYATGRKSNADTLDLHKTDIKVDKKNYIISDESMQTSVEGVFVTGDANGKYMLQHAAAFEVNHLGKLLYDGEKEDLEFKYMPHGVFTDPEIASVGLSEQKAKEDGIVYVTTTTGWRASAKALSTRLRYPKTKLLINPDTYEILGCHMIGPESTTMIHQVLAIMHIDNDIRHLKNMLYIHPALSEALLPAAVAVTKAAKEYAKSEL